MCAFWQWLQRCHGHIHAFGGKVQPGRSGSASISHLHVQAARALDSLNSRKLELRGILGQGTWGVVYKAGRGSALLSMRFVRSALKGGRREGGEGRGFALHCKPFMCACPAQP